MVIGLKQNLISKYRQQRTLKNSISFSGIGIHTGKEVQITFVPAPENAGITFCRVDLPDRPRIPASVNYVYETSRSTSIGINNVVIHTIEHVLAAVRANNIDNLCIEIKGIEPPAANGSSDAFVNMIEEVGILEQAEQKPVIKIQSPIHWNQEDTYIMAFPYDGYRISYTLNYPHSKLLNCQFYSLEVNSYNFKHEIASCRTFALYKEVAYLLDHGLAKGASLDNAVIIHEEAAFSKGGLFFPDEMVRHKILDMIGDLSLVGIEFEAHVIALRAGHASNCAFAKELLNSITECA
ncbi:UDP-3-O-[3-hydroxymyristoyl] N-acetylglucosamine deacetylase [Neochlamydia sp. EPS4]|nr:UDP-3-O-[3-hydroxymyristoyl] N-acetylglucosamine deacetylase [Neochlamydia sp. EPS4]